MKHTNIVSQLSGLLVHNLFKSYLQVIDNLRMTCFLGQDDFGETVQNYSLIF